MFQEFEVILIRLLFRAKRVIYGYVYSIGSTKYKNKQKKRRRDLFAYYFVVHEDVVAL